MHLARPAWPAPRTPLQPHRLAKLANALGVAAPLPAVALSPAPDVPVRSLTPSSPSPTPSKYLLHVIPPAHLFHEPDSPAQFRRGTLVALQSTLQAQLLLIAREYALPSTLGVVLYLVTASPHSGLASPSCDSGGADPGPRLSEEIWKHIWSRVLRAERDEAIALSPGGTPNPLALDLTVDPDAPSRSLRPFVIPARADPSRAAACPITPSTSTGSLVSDSRSHDRSEPNTPDTSRSSDNGPPGVELPGLSSHSIIPILAKVEFDIDRRKATWYAPWARSRRMKRTDSRSSLRSDSGSRTLDSSSPTDEKRALHDLRLTHRVQKPSFLRSLHDLDKGDPDNADRAPLSESPAAAPMTLSMQCDPLAGVFGTDTETWTEIHAKSDSVRPQLASDPTSLTRLPGQSQEECGDANDVGRVRGIMQRMSRLPLTSADSMRPPSPSTAVGRRPLLPPLILVPKSPTHNLAYRTAEDVEMEGLSLELEHEFRRTRSPGEEKRVGTVFEDLDLGLDLGDDDEEYDENDPNDRRRSQYIMKAKLDEIERTLAQFSPQQFKTEKLDDDSTTTHRSNVSTASQPHTPPNSSPGPLHKAWPSIPCSSVTKAANRSPTSANLPPSPPTLALNGVSTGAPKAFVAAASPPAAVSTESQLRRRELEQAIYPVVMSSSSRQANITSDSPIPLSSDPFGRHPSVYDFDAAPMQSYWDPVAQKFSHEPLGPSPSMSSTEDSSGSLTSAPSGRFSADSTSVADHGDRKSTAPLVSVKGFKKLWRRSKSSTNALPRLPTPARTSFQSPSSPTSIDQLNLPSIPGTMTKGPNGWTHTGQPQLDQTPAPSLSGSRPDSPAILLNTPPQDKPSVRKSILKSWKTVTGAGLQQPTNSSEPRKSSERPVSDETIKPRRPSVLDASIPPSPQLPKLFLPSNHVRTGSHALDHRKLPVRSKLRVGQHYSSASHDLLSAIPPVWSPVVVQTPGSASPFQTQFATGSRFSQTENRASVETSQLEIISAKAQPSFT